MQRREFLGLIGGAAVWPMLARTQQPARPVVGYLYAGAPEQSLNLQAAFRTGLIDAGFFEGRNVAIERRFANGDLSRLPELAADLVRRRVAVIVASRSSPAALAAKAASTTVPVVFSTGGDPVQIELVASLNRPGGNVTGITTLSGEVAPKRLVACTG